jgi:2-dehydro-3-deoxyphosphogluconate aldolase / (4S)-4-hydroxy-2-oxoglutarate aldolase
MTKDQVRARIEEVGIIPAIRLSSAEQALFAAEAVVDSGIPIMEVTMTVPGAVGVIEELVRKNSELIVGAGTVLDLETARRCMDAGARFVTGPGLDLEVLRFAIEHDILVFPGALTPTEIGAARKAGTDLVKVFPCSQVGGPSYIKTLRSPFPDVPLIASGGVNQHNAADFILAGAVALGIGRHLVQPPAIERHEQGWIRELAHRYLRIVKEARAQTVPSNKP